MFRDKLGDVTLVSKCLRQYPIFDWIFEYKPTITELWIVKFKLKCNNNFANLLFSSLVQVSLQISSISHNYVQYTQRGEERFIILEYLLQICSSLNVWIAMVERLPQQKYTSELSAFMRSSVAISGSYKL